MTLDIQTQENRIRQVYAERRHAGKSGLYAWYRPENLFNQYRLHSVAAYFLRKHGLAELSNLEILDVGCGKGGWLRSLAEFGAAPEKLHGIDLVEENISQARNLGGNIDFRVSSGWRLPFSDGSMDLVSAHTVFSSIMDPAARVLMAGEISRVVSPSGAVMIYDFRISHPRNPNTTGIRQNEIMRIFPAMSVESRTLTLAPPIARPLAKVFPFSMVLLEWLVPPLRTHAVYFLTPSTGVAS